MDVWEIPIALWMSRISLESSGGTELLFVDSENEPYTSRLT